MHLFRIRTPLPVRVTSIFIPDTTRRPCCMIIHSACLYRIYVHMPDARGLQSSHQARRLQSGITMRRSTPRFNFTLASQYPTPCLRSGWCHTHTCSSRRMVMPSQAKRNCCGRDVLMQRVNERAVVAVGSGGLISATNPRVHQLSPCSPPSCTLLCSPAGDGSTPSARS